ncbi:MAG: zinc ribbon domain-containing protein [Spirochaetes bacterium]|nr:zinc ribbon domain-containing protein [Spirochaetota bacterium]
MFFVGIFGVGSKDYKTGVSGKSRCPVCGCTNALFSYVNKKYFHIFFLPVWYWGERHFDKCENCWAALDYDSRQEGAGSYQYEYHQNRGVWSSAGQGVSCKNCGKIIESENFESGYKFCPFCGRAFD